MSATDPIKRRAFTESDVLDIIFGQGALIPCPRCRKALKRHECARDHKIALGTLPAEVRHEYDEPFNCHYLCDECHDDKTHGSKSSRLNSDLHTIAKQKRIMNGGKKKSGQKIPSRPFQKGHRPMRPNKLRGDDDNEDRRRVDEGVRGEEL